MSREAILVIKLSALGDMVQAFPAFGRIRSAHPHARLTLLTTAAYADLGRTSPWFDAVDDGGRPGNLRAWWSLVGRLRRMRPDRVYDLQNNDRTALLMRCLWPQRPVWSGHAYGARLRFDPPDRMRLHSLERHAAQLAAAGIWPDAPVASGSAPPPDVAWMAARAIPIVEFDGRTGRPLAILAPGAAPSRPAKRWPAEYYGALSAWLIDRGLQVAVIGGASERQAMECIARATPAAIDLVGRTSLDQIAWLGARAALAVGNDTGPMHILTAAGAPAAVLFSRDSDPELCAPRGRVRILRQARLPDLPVERVTETLDDWIAGAISP